MLDNRIALLGSHAASTQGVPCRLTVSLDPLLNMRNVFLGVLDRFVFHLLVRVEPIDFGGLAWLQWLRPAAMLDICGKMVGTSIRVGRHQVHVLRTSRRIESEMWVHGSHLTSVRLHTACSLSRLNVAPDHRGHVAFIVHEASIKVRCIVWIGRRDVSESSGKWILQKMEQCEEFTRGHVHVIAEPVSMLEGYRTC